MELKRTELANLLGITPALVTKLSSTGILSYGSKKGMYDVTACIQKYIEYTVEEVIKTRTPQSEENVKESLDYWKMQRQRAAAMREMGLLIPLSEAERIMSNRLTQIRDVISTIDSTWAPYIIGLKTLDIAQKTLGNLLDNTFEQLSSLPDNIEDDIVDEETLDDAE